MFEAKLTSQSVKQADDKKVDFIIYFGKQLYYY